MSKPWSIVKEVANFRSQNKVAVSLGGRSYTSPRCGWNWSRNLDRSARRGSQSGIDALREMDLLKEEGPSSKETTR